MSDGSGLDFCKEIRKQTVASILFFAAADSELEIMEAFVVGANDDIPTPYPNALTLDMVTTQATLNDVDLMLALKEFARLLLLIQGDGEYVKGESLYLQVWKRPPDGDCGALKTAIYRYE